MIYIRNGPISDFGSDTDIQYFRKFQYPILPISDTDISNNLAIMIVFDSKLQQVQILLDTVTSNVHNQRKNVILEKVTIL